MTNLDAMCQQTFDRHQQLLAEAAHQQVRGPSGGVRHDDPDGFGGIGLRFNSQ